MTYPPSTPPPGFGNQPPPGDGSYPPPPGYGGYPSPGMGSPPPPPGYGGYPSQPGPGSYPPPPGYGGYQSPGMGSPPYPPPPGTPPPYGMPLPPPQKGSATTIIVVTVVLVLLLGGAAFATFTVFGTGGESTSTALPEAAEEDEGADLDDTARIDISDLNVSHLELDGWAMDDQMAVDNYVSFYAAPENYHLDTEFAAVMSSAGPLEDDRSLEQRAIDAAFNFPHYFFTSHVDVEPVADEEIVVDGYTGHEAQAILTSDGPAAPEIFARSILLEMDTEIVALIGFTNEIDGEFAAEMHTILDSVQTLD